MLHFVYSYSERTPRNGHTVKRVCIYRIVRNEARHVTSYEETFVSKDQLILNALDAARKQGKAKGLPPAMFEKSQFGGWRHMLWSLKEAGIATFAEV